LKQRLQHADPIRREGTLSDAEVLGLRRRVLASVRSEHAGRRWFSLPFLLAAAALALVVGVTVFGIHARRSALDSSATVDSQPDDTRQVQFETPGGTRIIWVLSASNTVF